MKLKEIENLKKFAIEYVTLGLELGYFNNDNFQKVYNKLLNYDIEIDNNLSGDAFTDTNRKKIIINENKMKSNNENFSLVLFHKFTHINSAIHKDIFTKNGYLAKIRENVKYFCGTDIYNGKDINNINNPYNYILFGGLLIDEVTAEYIATQMINKKYNKNSNYSKYYRKYGNRIIEYYSQFKYYGIGEELIDTFSKTLFMKNNDKNINGLCKEIFKDNFVYDLIRQHNERPTSLVCLIKELALMGVIAHKEEQLEGHRTDQQSILNDTVYNAYYELKKLFIIGFEDRESIPDDVLMPYLP